MSSINPEWIGCKEMLLTVMMVVVQPPHSKDITRQRVPCVLLTTVVAFILPV